MPDDIGYEDIRERVRQQYERYGEPCPFEELQNICYFIAVLAHGTPDLSACSDLLTYLCNRQKSSSRQISAPICLANPC
jgi:hypothetical protein